MSSASLNSTMYTRVIFLTAICFIASGQKLGPKCPEGTVVMSRGMFPEIRTQVLNLHNLFRINIANERVPKQPKGINLKEIVYDDILAEKASAVSNNCVKHHLTVTDPRWKTVGQNVYISSEPTYNSTQDWKSAVTFWFMEHEHFTYPNKSNGHTASYTQIAWADTNHLGCDFIAFKNPKINMFTKLYTCNYGPGGNIPGEAPYITGTSGCANLC